MILLNTEYLYPLSGYPQLRGVAFFDAGNVYPGPMEMDLTKLHTGAGLGLRWKVQSFVNVTLRVDVAYGLDTGEQFTYAGTSVPF
jgi:outer membrane translocation and assembly module TamA